MTFHQLDYDHAQPFVTDSNVFIDAGTGRM